MIFKFLTNNEPQIMNLYSFYPYTLNLKKNQHHAMAPPRIPLLYNRFPFIFFSFHYLINSHVSHAKWVYSIYDQRFMQPLNECHLTVLKLNL